MNLKQLNEIPDIESDIYAQDTWKNDWRKSEEIVNKYFDGNEDYLEAIMDNVTSDSYKDETGDDYFWNKHADIITDNFYGDWNWLEAIQYWDEKDIVKAKSIYSNDFQQNQNVKPGNSNFDDRRRTTEAEDVDPFSKEGWEKYRSFKHGSATADKMAKDEDKRGNKRFGKYDDNGNWHSVSTSDPDKWKELKAKGYSLVESWKTPYFIKEATGKCKYCGCSIDSPDPSCDCKYDSHDASGSNWVNEGIYAKNKEDPMNPEVIIQGYGRLMLKQLESKVSSMFTELAEMCDKGNWSNVEYNLNKGLVQEFLKTITETYEELEQIRRRGGMNSRGIKQR